jgi:hypothetical protein
MSAQCRPQRHGLRAANAFAAALLCANAVAAQSLPQVLLPATAARTVAVHEDTAAMTAQQPLASLVPNAPGYAASASWAVSFDPLAGRRAADTRMPAPALTFDGLGAAGVAPPGISLAVGRQHVVQVVEIARLRVFDKDGAAQSGVIAVHSLFAGMPRGHACRSPVNDGAAAARYDSLADRWVVIQAIVAATPKILCIAVSASGDPQGSYHAYAYPLPTSTPFYFYPKLGVWTDAYHVSLARYDSTFANVIGNAAIAVDRHALLRGDSLARAVFVSQDATRGFNPPAYRQTLPSDLLGLVPPPPGLHALYAQPLADELGASQDMVRLFEFVPRFDNAAASTLSVVGDFVMAPFDGRSPPGREHVEQAEGELLDSQALTLQPSFAYRNLGTQANALNRWVGNFTVNVSGTTPVNAATFQAAVRWFEFESAGIYEPALRDEGTHSDTPAQGASGANVWVGAIAQDNLGRIALGYARASASERATPMIAARGVGPAGMLDLGESVFHVPSGVQMQTFHRWGDYSAMSVDPTDGCTFWHANEYYAQTASFAWRTRIGRFSLPDCPASASGTLQLSVSDCASGAPIAAAQIDVGLGAYVVHSNAQGDALLMASPGNYMVRARAPSHQYGIGSAAVVAAATTTAAVCIAVPVDAVFADGAE